MFHPWTISTLRTSLECKCSFNSKHILHVVLTIQIAHILLFNNTAHEKIPDRVDILFLVLLKFKVLPISLPVVGMLHFSLNEPQSYIMAHWDLDTVNMLEDDSQCCECIMKLEAGIKHL